MSLTIVVVGIGTTCTDGISSRSGNMAIPMVAIGESTIYGIAQFSVCHKFFSRVVCLGQKQWSRWVSLLNR